MSESETQTGQIQTQPAPVEGREDIGSDKNADSYRRPESKQRGQVATDFSGPDCLRLITIRMINVFKEIGLMLLIAFTYAAFVNE